MIITQEIRVTSIRLEIKRLMNLDVEKTNQLGESSPNFIFALVNLDPFILEKR